MGMKKNLQQIERIKAAQDVLTEWEKSFVAGITERAVKYGETLHISDKQAAILNKIFEERVGAGRPPKEAGSPFPASDNLPA